MQPVIRDARPSDAERIEQIRVAGWRAAYAGLLDPDWLAQLTVTPERISTWSERIEQPAVGAVTLVADAGEVLGFAALMPSRDEDEPEAAELAALYVDPPVQSTGIGSQLLLQGFARMLQPLQLLWVLDGNQPTRRFYERHGFAVDGARKVLDRVPGAGTPVEIRYRRRRLG